MILINLINEAFEDWVREYYCNMFDVTNASFKTYVQGKTLSVDANNIGSLLKLRKPKHSHYPFPDPDNHEYQMNELATVHCGEPTIWDFTVLKIFDLTSYYRLLNTFVCHIIEPRGHTSDLPYPRAFSSIFLGHRHIYGHSTNHS